MWSWGRGNKNGLEKQNNGNNRKLNDNIIIKMHIIEIRLYIYI